MHILNTETIYISVLENNPNYYICLSAQIPTYRGQNSCILCPGTVQQEPFFWSFN